MRVRGGFSLNGGVILIPQADLLGPAIGLAGRIGVQFNHYLGLYYQNSPIITLVIDKQNSKARAGFADYNSFIANLTLGNFFEIGAGPSIDFLYVKTGTLVTKDVAGNDIPSEIKAETTTGIHFGWHGRVAFNIGGLSGKGPRRSGFAIGFDAHPVVLNGALLLTITGGIGGEWY